MVAKHSFAIPPYPMHCGYARYEYPRQVLHGFEVLGQGGGTFELMAGDHFR